MPTFRTAGLTGRTPQSVSDALYAFMIQLYKSWYQLPRKSTRRHLDIERFDLADKLTSGLASQSFLALISAFVNDLSNMTGVRQSTGESLAEIKGLLDTHTSIELSEEEIEKLVAVLQVGEPPVFALRQMIYDPSKVESAFEELRALFRPLQSELNEQIQQQLQHIWSQGEAIQQDSSSDFATSQQTYERLLSELEQMPVVVRMGYDIFFNSKVGDASQLRTMRGGGGSRGGDSRGLDPKSPGGFGSEDALESFSPPIESSPGNETAPSTNNEVEAEMIQFYPDVRFPKRVQLRDEVPLIIQFTLEKHEESVVDGDSVGIVFDVGAVFANMTTEHVDVVLNAPGFAERTNVWSRTMRVFTDQDSQPAIFLLKAQEQGDQILDVSFYHRDKHLGQVRIETTISRQPTSPGTTPALAQIAAIGAPTTNRSEPADLELRITQGSEPNQLYFMLHSAKSRVGYHWRPVGQITLAQANPQQYLEYKFERMSQLAGELTANSTEEQIRETMRELRNVGQELFEDLFPEQLKNEYWRRIRKLKQSGVIHSLLVTSDEPWIPWEMVKPYMYDDFEEKEESDGFLCEEYQFCRWLAGRPPADQIKIKTIKTVVPTLDLYFAKEEQKYLEAFGAAVGVEVQGPLTTRSEVLDDTEKGGFQLLHFAAHGTFDAGQPNRSGLILEGNEELVPEDLSGETSKGLRKSRPIVFLNACHTSRINFSLTGLGGWAEKLVNTGRVSAFIGTLWEVNDELALAFSTRFYDELKNGQALGSAFSNARLYVRDLSPANPTWLAYTLYGDPNSKVTW